MANHQEYEIGPGGGVVLHGDKLRLLGKLIHYQEVNRIKSIPFRSEIDRAQYLRDSQETYHAALALLDQADEKVQRHRNSDRNLGSGTDDDPDDSVEEVVQKFLGYLEMAVGFGMQTVGNVHLRREFLWKVRGHADGLIPKINRLLEEELEPWQIEQEARELIDELALFKDLMYKSIIKKADPSSRNFSKVIKLSGNSFDELVAKYQKKLIIEKGSEYDKPFEMLEDEQKIEVFNEIIKSSGRGTFLMNQFYKVAEGVGKGLLVFTLGMSLWDIYSSEHKVQTTVKEGSEFAAGWAGGYVGEIAGAAAAEFLVSTVGVAASAVTAAFVGLTAFVTGFGLGIALGYLAGWVVDKIFSSGGKHTGGAIVVDDTKSPPQRPPHVISQLRVYAAPMPDGGLLARQLAYQGAK